MSAKVSGEVWDLRLDKDKKLVLLAYVDHADHEGNNIFPAIALIVWKTGYSEREVQRTTHELEAMGLLIPDGHGPHGTNKWRYPLGKGADILKTRGATMTPRHHDTGANPPVGGGDSLGMDGGDSAMAPEPKNGSNEKEIEKEKEIPAIDPLQEMLITIAGEQIWHPKDRHFREFRSAIEGAHCCKGDHTVTIAGVGVNAKVWQEAYAPTFERLLVGVYKEDTHVVFEP